MQGSYQLSAVSLQLYCVNRMAKVVSRQSSVIKKLLAISYQLVMVCDRRQRLPAHGKSIVNNLRIAV